MCNRIKLVCFLKFVAYKMNSEIIMSRIVVLVESEKSNVADVDVAVSLRLLFCLLASNRAAS
jgi:hypothetical protein